MDETVARILEQVATLRSIAAEFSLLGRPGELETETLDWPETVEKLVAAYRLQEAGLDADIVVVGYRQ